MKIVSQNKNKPFLKWAGGKTQLLPALLNHVPIDYNKYIEPFIGGGALFFRLTPERSIISDLNEELIITYKTIKDSVESVIDVLNTYKNEEVFYYKIRALNSEKLSNAERAARLIYLNKTCFNGLYRVNKNGEFNVPYGKRTNNTFLNTESLREASMNLKDVIIEHQDYSSILEKYAQKEDFVFLDPPYYPVGKHSDFKRYTKDFFYHEDQIKLKDHFDSLVKKGCFCILTNSNHPFILDLYKDYYIEEIPTKRMISSDPNTRNGVDIIVVGRK